MSKQTTITTNADEVYNKFLELTTKEMKKALKQGVGKAANQLKNATKKSLKQALPESNRKGKYNDKLVDAVRRSKFEENKNHEILTKVCIMGVKNTGSGTFRLRFFEKGTGLRKTRKGYNRGSINALYFFRNANATFQQEYDKILTDEINKVIDKINRQKLK
jgi:HK97 gp10 family phage protein